MKNKAFKELSRTEVDEVLRGERVVRIGFDANGKGTLEFITDSKKIEAVSPLLVSRFPDMPNWMQAEYAEKQERGEVVFVRIRPSQVVGRKSQPA